MSICIEDFDLSELVPALREPVLDWLAHHGQKPEIGAAVLGNPGLKAALPLVVACSPYIAETLGRYPEMLQELVSLKR